MAEATAPTLFTLSWDNALHATPRFFRVNYARDLRRLDATPSRPTIPNIASNADEGSGITSRDASTAARSVLLRAPEYIANAIM